VRAKLKQREQALTLLRAQPELSSREVARRVGVGNKTVSRWRSAEGLEQLPASDVLTSKDVCALIEEQGVRVDERRLRRWKQRGLMVPLGRQPLGRRFTYIWPRASVEQGLQVDGLLRRYRSADETLVALFGLRYQVDEQCLLQAYQSLLERRADGLHRLQLQLEAIADHSDDASWDDFAEDVFHTFATGRQWRSLRRMRAHAERHLSPDLRSSPADYVRTTMLDSANVLLRGRVGDDREIEQFFRRTNPRMLKGEHSLEEQIAAAKRLQRRMSLPTLLHLVENSSVAELARDRDDLLTVVKVVDGVIFRPMSDTYEFGDRYPNGFINDLIDGDPAGFGLLFLFFSSLRASPDFKQWVDEFIDLTKELLPNLDMMATQLIEFAQAELKK
jgi:hypothetical protein